MNKKFKLAPWDTNVKFGTWSTFFIAILIFTIVFLSPTSHEESKIVYTSFFILSVFLSIVYAMGPRGFYINDSGIVINRLIGSIIIPHDHIQSAELVKNAVLSRKSGNGGLFNYYGNFVDNTNTKVKVYATRFDYMIKIKAGDKFYYISPYHPEIFINILKQHLPSNHPADKKEMK